MNMFRVIMLMSLFLLCAACYSESVAPYAKLSARFDNAKIDRVETLLDVFAKANNLEVFRKSRRKMKVLSKGEDAFFTALYFKGDPVFIITNVGVANLLVLTVSDYKKMPVSELERLAEEFINSSELRLNITFVEVEQK